MKTYSHNILRVGIGITFLWVGILIVKEPLAWGSYLQPWAENLLIIPLKQVMLATAVLDLAVGLLLIVNILSWLAALVGAAHLTIVLITAGIDKITVRDIGLLAGVIALIVNDYPAGLFGFLSNEKKTSDNPQSG